MLPEILSLDLSSSGSCAGLHSSFSACGPACFFGGFPTCLPEKHGELKKFVCHLGCPTPVWLVGFLALSSVLCAAEVTTRRAGLLPLLWAVGVVPFVGATSQNGLSMWWSWSGWLGTLVLHSGMVLPVIAVYSPRCFFAGVWFFHRAGCWRSEGWCFGCGLDLCFAKGWYPVAVGDLNPLVVCFGIVRLLLMFCCLS